MNLDKLADRFQLFARLQTHGITPLYTQYSQAIADDRELLEISGFSQDGQPPPNMLYGAVHFLLLSGVQHPLADFYPTITPAAKQGVSFPHFRDFCLSHKDEIVEILQTRLTQTNEVGRCALLLPAFEIVSERLGRAPLHLIEIGPSAGLNLNWDRYRYRFGDKNPVGDGDSPLELATLPKGDFLPPIPDSFPQVATRVGVDVNPLNVLDPDNALWLQALVWPEHTDRMKRLQQALEIAHRYPPPLRQGDGVKNIRSLIEEIPAESTPVIFHSFVLYQLKSLARSKFYNRLAEIGKERDLYRVSIEWIGEETPKIKLDCFEDGALTQLLLARCNPHGQWIEWLHESHSLFTVK